MHIKKLISSLVVLLCLLAIPVAFGKQSAQTLKVISFNVLAPCWASPALYPSTAVPLLERTFRRDRIISFLQSQAATTDIFALQETTAVELGYFKAALLGEFEGFGAYHAPTYWSQYITQVPPWEPNGVALFVKNNTLTDLNFQDIALSDSGNHAAIVNARLKNNTNQPIRIASIHLDSDKPYNRNNEMKALLNYIQPINGYVDIIAGDANFETSQGNFKQDLIAAHFTDVLAALKREEQTSPYSSTYYSSSNWGVIDHVLIRNGTPSDGQVFNFNLWNLYPNDEAGRITANMLICGSDHFPISGVIAISN